MKKNGAFFKFFSGTKEKLHSAFTVAEMLTVMAVIGVVTTLTAAVAINAFENQKLELTKTVINNEIAVILADMHADGNLIGLSSNDFEQKFATYYGATNVTNSTGDYFAKNVSAETNSKYNLSPNDISSMMNDASYAKFTTTKGASIAMKYNGKYAISSKFVADASKGTQSINKYNYEAKNLALGAVDGFYDVNGAKGPNKVGADIFPLNSKTNGISSLACDSNFVAVDDSTCKCSITNTICRENNKILDSETCSCQCKRSCPKGQILNEADCSCGCTKTSDPLMDTSLAVFDPNSCGCKVKNIFTPARCVAGKGVWDSEHCRCLCTQQAVDECSTKSNGFAAPDPSNSCALSCKCGYKFDSSNNKMVALNNTEFQNQVKANAKKANADGTVAAKYTVQANNSGTCITCKSSSSSDVVIKEDKGFCKAGCAMSQEECEGDLVQGIHVKLFTGYNPNDEKNSCKCKCNTSGLKAKADAYNKQLADKGVKITAKTSTKTDWNADHKVASFVDAYNAYNAAYIGHVDGKGVGNCAGCGFGGRSTHKELAKLVTIANTGGVLKDIKKGWSGCSMTSPSKGKWSDVNANDYLKVTVDSNACKIKLENNIGKLKDAYFNSNVYYHCTHGVCKVYHYKGARTTSKSLSTKIGSADITGLVSGSWTYSYIIPKFSTAYDPVVLYLGTSTADVTPSFIASDNNKFKIECANDACTEFEDVPISWVQYNEAQPWGILVRKIGSKNPTGEINVSYLFSDQLPSSDGNAYATGLVQLRDQYDKSKDGLINGSERDDLFIWRDKNNNKRIDANELVSLANENIFEINTAYKADYDEEGKPKQDANAIFSIRGEYKRLVAIDNNFCAGTVTDKFLYPYYDESGKKLANVWEVRTRKEICDYPTQAVKVDNNETAPAREVYFFVPTDSSTGYYKDTWYVYAGLLKASDYADRDTTSVSYIKIQKLENKKTAYTDKIFTLTDIIFKSPELEQGEED